MNFLSKLWERYQKYQRRRRFIRAMFVVCEDARRSWEKWEEAGLFGKEPSENGPDDL